MKFIKLIVLIIVATFSTWVFAQNNESPKLIAELSRLKLRLAEAEAKKSALDFFLLNAFKEPEKLKHDSKDLNSLQKIENEIMQAIIDQAADTFFGEQIVSLDQKNKTLEEAVINKEKQYYQLLYSIPDSEKEFRFIYDKEIVHPPLSKSRYYLIITIIVILVTLILIAQMNVLSVRKKWRAREPEWTFLFKWVGFGWLLPILICSCQSGKVIEIEFFNPQNLLEIEIQQLKDSIKKQENLVENNSLEFDKRMEIKQTKEPIFRKSKDYLEAFKYEENLTIAFDKMHNEFTKKQDILSKLKEESITKKRNSSINETIFLSLLIGSLFFGGVFISWSMVNALNNSKVCPRCFEFGTLVQSPESKDELKCTSEFCKDNSFRLPKRFQNFTKLSFPMISCGSAGKTHWLLNIYSMNRKGYISIKKNAALYKIDVIDNKEFNIRERALAEQTSGGASIQPTLATTTPPLIFSLKDNKNLPLGFPDALRSRGLSLCFDYAGEVRLDRYKETQDMIARSNGIVFFLDVINIDKSQIDFTNRKNNKLDQLLMTNNYDTQFQTDVIVGKTYADFVIARDLTEPNPLDLPVAICLSKIDLLPFQGPLKGTYGEKFLKELENCKHPANKWSLSTIMDRSDIIRNYLPLIFANKGMIEI
ncbi:MAG: hypothetical protein WCJ72_17765, partial [Chryseobacterium sp.]